MVWPSGFSAIVFTDIDGTMVSSDYRVGRRARAVAGRAEDAGVLFVMVTSKTLGETLAYYGKLGIGRWGVLAVVEEGALVYSSPGLLSCDGRPYAGGLVEHVLAEPVGPGEVLELVAQGCRSLLKPIQWMRLEELVALTGLPEGEAREARRRRYTVALAGPRRCLEEAYYAALASGFYARLGRRFVHVSRSPGKAAGVSYVLRCLAWGRGAPSFGLGDDAMDEGFLWLVDRAVVVPSPSPSRPRPPPGAVVAPAPAPEGWVWALEDVVLRSVVGQVYG